MIKFYQGICVGIALFLGAQYMFLPVLASCEEAFTRQTVKYPAWAKAYWEEVAKRVKEQKQ